MVVLLFSCGLFFSFPLSCKNKKTKLNEIIERFNKSRKTANESAKKYCSTKDPKTVIALKDDLYDAHRNGCEKIDDGSCAFIESLSEEEKKVSVFICDEFLESDEWEKCLKFTAKNPELLIEVDPKIEEKTELRKKMENTVFSDLLTLKKALKKCGINAKRRGLSEEQAREVCSESLTRLWIKFRGCNCGHDGHKEKFGGLVFEATQEK